MKRDWSHDSMMVVESRRDNPHIWRMDPINGVSGVLNMFFILAAQLPLSPTSSDHTGAVWERGEFGFGPSEAGKGYTRTAPCVCVHMATQFCATPVHLRGVVCGAVVIFIVHFRL